jgi:hypothetical protein
MSETRGWTTPADLTAELERLWERGRLLTDLPAFPLELRLRRPDSRALGEDFDAARRWIRALEAGAREALGYGYTLRRVEIDHRQLGRNMVPVAAVVPTRDDALRLCGKLRDAGRFQVLWVETATRQPALLPWLEKYPLRALAEAGHWSAMLDVVDWMCRHPRPGCYIRQIEVLGVDTKFIEGHRGLLAELLNLALPTEAVEPSATGAGGFERRFGLRSKPATVRFRVLDAGHRIGGLSDLSVPVEDFEELNPSCGRVFITENEVNGLAFPDTPDSLVVFGLGYTLDRIAGAKWLAAREVNYWGDLDTHGFAILSRLRGLFPHARSLLMDRATLLTHRALCVREEKPLRSDLAHLTTPEHALYDDLRHDRLGDAVRLEQERIGFGWVREAIAGVVDAAPRRS